MTRIIPITGGLGNQMFQYAFGLSLREQGYRVIYIVLDKKGMGHYGFELDKVFIVENILSFSSKIYSILYLILKHLPKALANAIQYFFGLSRVINNDNFRYYPLSLIDNGDKSVFLCGTWQSELYFQDVIGKVLASFRFRDNDITEYNLDLASCIKNCNSVAIHVRRGDYLSEKYINGFCGICTTQYYQRAVNYIENLVTNPVYFIFSDDIVWAKNNLDFGKMVFIDKNQGVNSWQDMYLMSCCKHNIIANSTFSWWGAYLNPNPEKIVIAPHKWWNGIDDDVVPNAWIRV